MVSRLTGSMRWLLRSSTLRLTLLLSVIFAVGMAIAVFLALSFGRDAVLGRVDATLASLAAAVEADDDLEDTRSVIIRPLSEIRGLPQAFSRVAQRGGGTVRLDRPFNRAEDWRALLTRDADGELVLIALPIDDSEDALDVLAEVLWTTVGIILCIVILIGLAVGVFAQRRLARINKTLDRLATGDLQARTGLSSRSDDLGDLAKQVDKSAAELERLVAQTRNLSAAIAHDLRTPLARLRAQLEMLPQGQERGAALEEAGRLAEIFDTIMRVARIEAAQGQEGFDQVDLGDLTAELEETFGAVVEDGGKRLTAKVSAAASVFADRKMLVQAMANLIQNALVHGGDDITLFVHGRQIGVADNGPGVEPAQYDEILKPMVRLDAARNTDGSGLGLALVRAVADRHAARLHLSQNTPQGLRVALKFADL